MSFSFGPGLVQQRGPGPGFTKQPFQKDPWRGGGVAGGGQTHQGHGNWFSSMNPPPKIKMAPTAILPNTKIITTSDIYTPSSTYVGLSGRFSKPQQEAKSVPNIVVVNNNGGGGGDGIKNEEQRGVGINNIQQELAQTQQELNNLRGTNQQFETRELEQQRLIDQTERELRTVQQQVVEQRTVTIELLNNAQNTNQTQLSIIRQNANNEIERLENTLQIQRQNQTAQLQEVIENSNSIIQENRNNILNQATNVINTLEVERDAAIKNRNEIATAATDIINTIVDQGRTAISEREVVIQNQQRTFETVQEQIVAYHQYTSDYIRNLEETLWTNANEMEAREHNLQEIWQRIQATNNWQEFDYENIQIVIENRENDLQQLINLMNQSAQASNERFREITNDDQLLVENNVASGSQEIFVERMDIAANLPGYNQGPQWTRLQEKILQWQNEIIALQEQAEMIRQALNQRLNPTSNELYRPNRYGQSTLTLQQQNELLLMNTENTNTLEDGLVDDSMLLDNDVSPTRYVHQQIEMTNQGPSVGSVVVRTPSTMNVRNNNSSLVGQSRVRSRSPLPNDTQLRIEAPETRRSNRNRKKITRYGF